jgi:hypothetical protein
MHGLRCRLTYANVTATLALVIAVAGGTTAVAGRHTAPKNSVTTKSIRPNNVTASDLTRIQAMTKETTFTDAAPANGMYTGDSALAQCPSGTRLVSGSAAITGGGSTFLNSSHQVGQGWAASGSSDGGGAVTITAIANCLAAVPQKQ